MSTSALERRLLEELGKSTGVEIPELRARLDVAAARLGRAERLLKSAEQHAEKLPAPNVREPRKVRAVRDRWNLELSRRALDALEARRELDALHTIARSAFEGGTKP